MSGSAAPAAREASAVPRQASRTLDDRRRSVAEALEVTNPANHGRDIPAQSDPRVECQIELEVDDIRAYEHNPRHVANAKFAEIKESIRASGIRNPLTVTRRPGESHFIVEAGGNTRLAAIQQLWAETSDPRFSRLTVMFRPWRSESHVLTSHLIENEQRGDMTFWDRANAIVALKARIESERGQRYSIRQLEAELGGLGISVNIATLAHSMFAAERLRILGDRVSELSGLDVKVLQPRLNALKRYAQGRKALDEDQIYATVFEPAFRQIGEVYAGTGRFSAVAVVEACEEALSRALDEPLDAIRRGCSLGGQPGPATSDDGATRTEVAAAITEDRPSPSVSTANALASSAANARRIGEPAPSHERSRASADALIDAVVRFAVSSGIECCVERDAAARWGFRLHSLTDTDPTRQRPWDLLAGISGERSDPAAEATSDAEILLWLTDPSDEAAGAFWSVLSRLRDARSGTHAPSDAVRATTLREDG